ncbi:hypothetical protein A3K63_04875 [Candidatus Micrarchaeota archaeon RBG_16_49_10]|nr:MAG: hypothetical protein A3K63_04875 [Candidatus Micrarchaeota archaeon RBG_16_49_10]
MVDQQTVKQLLEEKGYTVSGSELYTINHPSYGLPLGVVWDDGRIGLANYSPITRVEDHFKSIARIARQHSIPLTTYDCNIAKLLGIEPQ